MTQFPNSPFNPMSSGYQARGGPLGSMMSDPLMGMAAQPLLQMFGGSGFNASMLPMTPATDPYFRLQNLQQAQELQSFNQYLSGNVGGARNIERLVSAIERMTNQGQLDSQTGQMLTSLSQNVASMAGHPIGRQFLLGLNRNSFAGQAAEFVVPDLYAAPMVQALFRGQSSDAMTAALDEFRSISDSPVRGRGLRTSDLIGLQAGLQAYGLTPGAFATSIRNPELSPAELGIRIASSTEQYAGLLQSARGLAPDGASERDVLGRLTALLGPLGGLDPNEAQEKLGKLKALINVAGVTADQLVAFTSQARAMAESVGGDGQVAADLTADAVAYGAFGVNDNLQRFGRGAAGAIGTPAQGMQRRLAAMQAVQRGDVARNLEYLKTLAAFNPDSDNELIQLARSGDTAAIVERLRREGTDALVDAGTSVGLSRRAALSTLRNTSASAETTTAIAGEATSALFQRGISRLVSEFDMSEEQARRVMEDYVANEGKFDPDGLASRTGISDPEMALKVFNVAAEEVPSGDIKALAQFTVASNGPADVAAIIERKGEAVTALERAAVFGTGQNRFLESLEALGNGEQATLNSQYQFAGALLNGDLDELTGLGDAAKQEAKLLLDRMFGADLTLDNEQDLRNQLLNIQGELSGKIEKTADDDGSFVGPRANAPQSEGGVIGSNITVKLTDASGESFMSFVADIVDERRRGGASA